jgi:hypothetical protein
MKLLIKRGLDTTRQLITFDEGELILATDTGQLFIGDGKTAGGIKISPSLKGLWSEKTFAVNDIVSNNGSSYFCKVAHTGTSLTEPGLGANWDQYWQLMSEKGEIGIQVKGDWDATQSYSVGDFVSYLGSAWVCKTPCVNVVPENGTYWILASEKGDRGLYPEGIWSNATNYKKDSIVVYNGEVFRSLVDNNKNSVPDKNAQNWEKFVSKGYTHKGEYQVATSYTNDDIVFYSGSTWRCISETTEAPDTTSSSWELVAGGIVVRGKWSNASNYQKNDIVEHAGSTWRSNSVNVTSEPSLNNTDWELVSGGIVAKGEWQDSIEYDINDIVAYSSSTWRAKVKTTSKPSKSNVDWELLSGGLSIKGDWDKNISYKLNDLVYHKGSSYLNNQDVNLGNEPSITDSTWSVLGKRGLYHRGAWSNATQYYAGDAVSYHGESWYALSDSLNITPAEGLTWTLLSSKGTIFKGQWVLTSEYKVDDLVTHNGSMWISLVDSTNSEPSLTNTDWLLVASKGDKGIQPIGQWSNSTNYVVGDFVNYLGSGYISKGNTPSGTLPTEESFWAKVVDKGDKGVYPQGQWSKSKTYKMDDIVVYNGQVFRSLIDNNLNIIPVGDSTWELFLYKGYTNKGVWNNSSVYQVDDLVVYASSLWRAITSGSNNNPAITKDTNWELVAGGITLRNAWDSNTAYKINDIVTYSNSTWLSKTENTNSEPTTSSSDWEVMTSGVSFAGTWASTSKFNKNDIVLYKGNSYISLISNNLNNEPSDLSSYWSLVAKKGIVARGAWSNITQYYAGDVVHYLGNSWYALNDSLNVIPVEGITWTLLASKGMSVKGQWLSGTSYLKDDVVFEDGSSWLALADNTNSRPVTGNSNWTLITQKGDKGIQVKGDWNETVTYELGDLVYYNGSGYVAKGSVAANVVPTDSENWSKIVSKGDKGDPGKNFTIAKVYASSLDLHSDVTPSNIEPGEFAIINTGNVEADEDARLYLWNGSSYQYITDMSGLQGIQGPRGMNHKGDYNVSYEYAKDDAVIYGGSYYVSLQDSNLSNLPITHPAYWAMVASKGDYGIKMRGEWNLSDIYTVHDSVSFNGSHWICIQDHSGIAPEENAYWTLLVHKGDAGVPGPQGAPGFNSLEVQYAGSQIGNSVSKVDFVGGGSNISYDAANAKIVIDIEGNTAGSMSWSNGADFVQGTKTEKIKIVGDSITLGYENGEYIEDCYSLVNANLSKTTIVSVGGELVSGKNGSNYLTSSTFTSVNVLSGKLNTLVESFSYVTTSIPDRCEAKLQFSQDGISWVSASGVVNEYTELLVGSNTLDLTALNYVTPNFYYKLTYLSDGTATPSVSDIRISYSPKVYASTNQTWTSNVITSRDYRSIKLTAFKAAWSVTAQNVKPRFRIAASDVEDFSSGVTYFPSAYLYYQNGSTAHIENGVWLDLSAVITSSKKYWKIIAVLNSGTDTNNAPVISQLDVSYLIDPVVPVMGKTFTSKGTWNINTPYVENDLVEYNGSLWYSETKNLGSTPSVISSDWGLFASKGDKGDKGDRGDIGIQGPQGIAGLIAKGEWSSGTTYGPFDVVQYANGIWKSKQTNNSNNIPSQSPDNWELLVQGMNVKSDWSSATSYAKNDLVTYANAVYCSLIDLNVNNVPVDGSKWKLLTQGLSAKGSWSSSTNYYYNDLVTYKGTTYRSITNNNLNNTPPINASDSNWDILSKRGLALRGVWSSLTQYYEGDVVSYNGQSFASIQNSLNVIPVEEEYWTLIASSGLADRGAWASGLTYEPNDLVFYDGSTWRCLAQNINVEPVQGTEWTIFARQGQIGPQGNIGPIGPKGDPGTNIVPMGIWNEWTTYPIDACVTYEGSAWRSLGTTTGDTPQLGSSAWEIFLEGSSAPERLSSTQNIWDKSLAFNNQNAIFTDGLQKPSVDNVIRLAQTGGTFYDAYSNFNNINAAQSSNYAYDVFKAGIGIKKEIDYGTGADGNITISANSNINVMMTNGRTQPDGISFNVTSLTSNTAVLSSVPNVGALNVNDEVILINLMGTPTNYSNVGNYEFLRVKSVSGSIITFQTNKTKFYGQNSLEDTNIGITPGTNQIVVIQRVPNYNNVTINSGVSLTCNNWNELLGGIIAFRVSGSLSNFGVITAEGKGYLGGAFPGNSTGEGPGYKNFGSTGITYSAIGGGSDTNSYVNFSYVNSRGGGGGYRTQGICCANFNINPTSIDPYGTTYGDDYLIKLYFGSGGGIAYNGSATVNGGNGGGIVFIGANSISLLGSILSPGTSGSTTLTGYCDPGAGAGGSILIKTISLITGTNILNTKGAAQLDSANIWNDSIFGGSGIAAVYYKNKSGAITSSGTTKEYPILEYSTSSVVSSINLLASPTTVTNIKKYNYTMSQLPNGTTAKIQFSKDGTSWYNSSGIQNQSNLMNTGSRSIDLTNLGWTGKNLYTKITLTSDGTGTPIIQNYTIEFDPIIYTSSEQSWTSNTINAPLNQEHRLKYMSIIWNYAENDFAVNPKFQLLASNTGAFSGEETIFPAGIGTYFQEGGTYDFHPGEEVDLTQLTQTGFKYYRVKAYLVAGGDYSDTPEITSIEIGLMGQPTLNLVNRGSWNNAVNYSVGDIVTDNGILWRCLVNNTNSQPTATNSNWQLYLTKGLSYKGTYSAAVSYILDDIVEYHGQLYKALKTTTGNTPVEGSNWTILLDSLKYVGAWNSSTLYAGSDVVTYHGQLWKALATSTNVIPVEGANWTLLNNGLNITGTWNSATAYAANDIVVYANSIWKCNSNNTNSIPSVDNVSNWTLYAGGLAAKSEWSSVANYQINDLVTYSGTTWRCTQANTNQTPSVGAYWEIFAAKGEKGDASTIPGPQGIQGIPGLSGSGLTFKGPWDFSVEYSQDDCVEYLGSAWRSVANSNSNNYPDSSSSWELFVQGANSPTRVSTNTKVWNGSLAFNAKGTIFSTGIESPSIDGKLKLEYESGLFKEKFENYFKLDSAITSNIIIRSGRVEIKPNIDYGTGLDGNIIISSNSNINTMMTNGRTVADGIAYNVTSLTATQATCSATVLGIAEGDEVLLINLQGPNGGSYVNVGNYETLRIKSIVNNIVTFATNKQKYYGNGVSDDTNIGTATSNQRVILQRIPNYNNVTINSGVTLTCNGWDGQKGGIVVFKSAGTLTNNGTIDVSGKGYSGGNATIGEGLNGIGGLGGGGYYTYGYSSGTFSGGAGGNVIAGAGGYGATPGGSSYNTSLNNEKLYFGAGGGSSKGSSYGNTGVGGSGGGIVLISSYAIGASSLITAKGAAGTVGVYSGMFAQGGGGAGGTILINTLTLTLGTNSSDASGSPTYSQGSYGRIVYNYSTKSGTISAASLLKENVVTLYPLSATLKSVNVLSSYASVTDIQSFKYYLPQLPANTSATIQFSQNETSWYSSTGVINTTDTLLSGNNTIDLSSLLWTGSNLYYKIVFTSDGKDTPSLDTILVNFAPVYYYSSEQYWESDKFIAPTNSEHSLASLKVTIQKATNDVAITPRFQILGSQTGVFLGEETVLPSISTYLEESSAISTSPDYEWDLTSISNKFKYWKVRSYLASGGDLLDSPTISNIQLKLVGTPTVNLVSRGTWNNTDQYYADDIVIYKNSLWRAKVDNLNQTPVEGSTWTLYLQGMNNTGVWNSGTIYDKNDIVTFHGQTWRALQLNSNQEPAENTYWTMYAGGQNFVGTWIDSVNYKVADIVTYRGNTWRCISNHTSVAGTPPIEGANWTIYSSGINNMGQWSSTTQYTLNDVVQYANGYWRCKTLHTNQIPADGTYWESIARGIYNQKGTWSAATQYAVDDVVSYSSGVWHCLVANINSAPTNTNSNWESIAQGYTDKGVWSSASAYLFNDVVTYGGSKYRCILANTNQVPSSADTYWQVYIQGQDFKGAWSAATAYKKQDMVQFGGQVYIALQDGTNQKPSTANTYWSIYNKGVEFKGTWNNATTYEPGQVIVNGGTAWYCLTTNVNSAPVEGANWTLYGRGVVAKGSWSNSAVYAVDDLVSYEGQVWQCKLSNTNQAPQENTYWTLFVAKGGGLFARGPWDISTEYNLDDIVTYEGSTWRSLLLHSGIAPNSSPTTWEKLAAKGDPGLYGKGEYSASTTYNSGDLVSYMYSSYACNFDNTTGFVPTDTSKWTLVAEQGLEGCYWKGQWNSNNTYIMDDVVFDSGGSWIALQTNVNKRPSLDGGLNWDKFTEPGQSTVSAYLDGGTIAEGDGGIIGVSIDDTQLSGSYLTTWSSAKIWEMTQKPKLFNYSEKFIDLGNSGANCVLNLANANVFKVLLTANCTFSFTGAQIGSLTSFSLIIQNDATPNRTISWPLSTKWESAIIPYRTTGANAIDIWTFFSYDGGNTWIGSLTMVDIR